MPEKRIIARATAAGSRRLQVVPLETLAAPDDESVGGIATSAPPATGLNAFLATAQRQGAALVEAAREQAEQIAATARADGYEVGQREGREQALREVADLLTFAEAAVREVADTRARLLDESETALVALAIHAAEKILHATLEAEPERVADVLRGALRKAYVRDQLQVVCNPDDLALLEAASDDLRTKVGTLKHLELVGDRRISRGGVMVRTPGGDVDGRLETQLDRLRQAMLREESDA